MDDNHLVLPAIVKAMLAAGGDPLHARLLAAKNRAAPERAIRLLEKAAVGTGHLGDGDFGEALADWRIATTAFFGSLRNRSVFFRLWDQGLRRVPARTLLGVVTLDATAWSRAEGAAAPISRLTLSTPAILPQSATALLVVSNEVARSADPAAQTLVTNALREAVADVVDNAFFTAVIDSGTASQPSIGNDREGMKADLMSMLSAVNVTAGGALFWVMSPDVANGASILDEAGTMTPLGGELLGLPALVGSTIPAGIIRLINAAEIAAAMGTIDIDVSTQAAIEMLDTPVGNGVVPTDAALVSLWQTGAVGTKVDVSFGVERLRVSAIAEVTDVHWAAPASR